MAKQNRATRSKTNEKGRAKAKPIAVEELTDDLAGIARLPAGTIQAQVAWLRDVPLQRAQRQALALQIGRVQGNRHLQRVIIARAGGGGKKGTPKASSKWMPKGVLKILAKDPDGPPTVKVLNSYSVYSYDSYTYKRQYYTDATKTTKKRSPELHSIGGYHSRKKKEIGLKTKRSNAVVASTLVHEVVHAKQHMAYEKKLKKDPTATPPTKAAKEYEAHIKQEKFNIRRGIPSKDPSFRKKVKGKWVADEAAIRKWVDRVYGIGPKKYYDDYDFKKTGVEGPIGPWKLP